MKNSMETLHFYALKLPFVYCIAAMGFVFEFFTTLPFAIAASIDARRRGHRVKKRGKAG